MTAADLARRLFRDQCGHNDLSSYGERAAIAAMVPLIEALQGCIGRLQTCAIVQGNDLWAIDELLAPYRAALTPQPEEVA